MKPTAAGVEAGMHEFSRPFLSTQNASETLEWSEIFKEDTSSESNGLFTNMEFQDMIERKDSRGLDMISPLFLVLMFFQQTLGRRGQLQDSRLCTWIRYVVSRANEAMGRVTVPV